MKFLSVVRRAGWALVAGGVLAAVAWWWQGRSASEAPRYETEAVDRGSIVQTVSANGTLNPLVLVNVGTQVSGTVKRLAVDFNDRVQQGQVLMELDDSLLRAQVQQSRAQLTNNRAALALARTQEARLQKLFAQGFASQEERDAAVQARVSAESAVAVNEAQLARDATNLSYTVIRSPVAGIVVSREVDLGQTVAASFQTPTLFKIAQDLRQMQINSSFAEADVGSIKEGQAVTFRVDAFPDRQFKGVVQQIRLNPTTQSNVVTYNVVVSVANPDESLLPGMTAYVSIETARRAQALRVPNAALRFRPQASAKQPAAGRRGAQVYVLRQQAAVAVPVKTGISDGRFTEIVGGELKPGERVITDDLQRAASNGKNDQPPGNFRMRPF